jgi:hypothetical protein
VYDTLEEVLENRIIDDEEIRNLLEGEGIWCGDKVFNVPGKGAGTCR